MEMLIRDICTDITDGSHNPPKGIDSGEFMMLSSKNVFDGRITFDEPRYLTEADFINEDKRTQIEVGDVLMTIVGTVGRVAVVDESMQKFTLQRSVAVLRPKNEICSSKYLMYALQAKRNEIERKAKGVAQKGIYLKEVGNLDVNVLDRTMQDVVVSGLDRVAAILIARQQQLQKLDELVKARFAELFGDPISNPHGFEKVDLSELADIKIGPFGSLLHKEDYIEGGYALLNPSHIIDGKIAPDSKLTVSREKYEELSVYHLKAGDVVMGRRGEMGRCAVVPCDGYLCGTGSLLIRTKGDVTADYIQKIISFPSFKKTIEDMAVGQTMPNLNVPIVSRFQIIKPPIEVQHSYYAFVEQVDKSKVAVQKALDEAQLLFDSLMQKYFE